MKEQIRTLIAQGKTQEALTRLQSFGDEFTVLLSRYERLQRENRMGILRRDDFSREINTINFAILEAIERVDDPPLQTEVYPDPPLSTAAATQKYKVFLSYAHEDQDLFRQLDAHFAGVKRSGRIGWWDDTRIQAGAEWHQEIQSRIRQADLVLLLVSADFLNSKYIWEHELSIAMDRWNRRETLIVPVILRPCDWHAAPFARLQALPSGALPVTKWEDRDEAFLNVVKGIKNLLLI